MCLKRLNQQQMANSVSSAARLSVKTPIEPFSSLVNTVKSTVPRLLLNCDPVGPFEQRPLRRGDYMELADLSDSVRKLAEILGWHTEVQDLMNSHENELCSYPDPSNSSSENSYSSETDSIH